MGKKEKVEAMIEGGKATAAPPLGQALGPLGVNIGQIVSEINKKTEAYKGMKVPVTVLVDTTTKTFEIVVGSPPTSGLIKKEIGIEEGSGIPNKDKKGNLAIEDVIKIAKMKRDAMLVKSLKAAVKCVVGSCNSLGVLVEGKKGKDINKDIDAGAFDKQINAEKTDVSPEKRAELKAQLDAIQKSFAKDLEAIRLAQEAKKAAGEAPAEGAATGAPASGAKPVAGAPPSGAKPAAATKPAAAKK